MPKLKPGTTKPTYASLTVRFPEDVLEVLRVRAREGDRSLNAEIVRTVRLAIAHDEARQQGGQRDVLPAPRRRATKPVG